MLKKLLSCLLALVLCIGNFTALYAEEPISNDDKVIENVALNKKVLAASGNPSRAVDGDINTYWDGGNVPSELFLDLNGYYDVTKINVIPYFGGSRYYHYEVYVSVDGTTYEKVGEKTTDETQTSKGEEYVFDAKTIRYVKVKMLYNSSNPSAHINELEVYGVENPDYQEPEKPSVDPNDPDNIAFGKPTRSTTNESFTQLTVDGDPSTSWSGEDFPKYVDVDLLDNYDISKIHIYMPQGTMQFAYTLYGSLDGVHFDTIAKSKLKSSDVNGDVYEFDNALNYRVLRVNVTANSARQGANSMISEIKVYGQKNDSKVTSTRDKITIQSYEDWLKASYDVEVEKDSDGHYDMNNTFTQNDVMNEVKGLISRLLGDSYQEWFSFEIAENPKQNGKDYYELSMKDNKIHIKGNEGLSLTTGLNYYLKYYCNVHVSQQTSQVQMPATMPVLSEPLTKESPYEIRYAYNYCTLSYTMPFWGYDEWQRELDYFALNGVNTILDTTATEALWITYLQNYGYDADDAKAFVSGYAYKAWWLMGNLESYGGPVSDEWVQDTVQMARINQRKMSILGMKPVLQGFMGAMPENFAEKANHTLMTDYHYEDIRPYMVKQGDWSGFVRPPILKTTYDGYNEMAAAFYEAQEAIYGQVTNYYAGDLAHEGGIIPPDLSKPEMSAHILDQMMNYDNDAVWIIQSWLSNPDPEILQGFGENKEDHVLVLDLDATENPHWSNTTNWNGKEFGGTSWVFCMLDNYGGRTGMHGELEYLATQITKANQESTHMKGIGISPEGTLLNPVNYDLLWEMGWESEAKDTKAWLKDYITRRYGVYSDNTWNAWKLLLDSAYSYNNADGSAKYHTGNNNCITNMMPSFEPQIVIGSYEISYDPAKVEQAMDYLLKDFDQFKDNECYIYDVVDILRQVTSNTQLAFFKRITEAYDAENYDVFAKYKDKLLDSIMLLDEIAAFEKDSLLGTWVSKAKNFYNDERNSAAQYDDYAKDMMVINAKAIVGSWSSKTLQTYAHRQYHGLEKDYNYPMWKLWLDALDESLKTGVLNEPSQYTDYFNIGWNLVISDNDYTDDKVIAPDGDDEHRGLKDIYQLIHEQYLTAQAEKDKIINENVAVKGNAYAQSTLGSNAASRINDNKNDTLWIAGSAKVPVYAGVTLDKTYSIYKVQLVFEKRPTPGKNVMDFYLEAKQNDGSWKKVYTGKTFDEATQNYMVTIDFEEQIQAEDLRITYTSNGGIYPALAEMKIYSSQGIQVIDETSMFIADGKLNGVKTGSRVSEIKENLYIGSGELVFEDNNTILEDNDTVNDGTIIRQVNNGVVINELVVALDIHLKEDLKAFINETDKLNPNLYSKQSYMFVQEILKEAKQVLSSPQSSPSDYRNVYDKLKAAVQDLVDITLLKDMLHEYADRQPEDYQAAAYEKYLDYYGQAKELFAKENATKEEIYMAQGYAELAGNYLIREQNSNVAVLGTPHADNELSSYYGKTNLNNGEADDCWVATSLSNYPVSAGITLDKGRAVDNVKVVFEQNAYRNTQLGFYVSIKKDGNWEKVFAGTTGSKGGYTFLIDIKGEIIEDVNVTITSYKTDSGSPYPGIAEIEIYEHTDITELQRLFEEADKKFEQGYDADSATSDSWKSFDESYRNAEMILGDSTYAQSRIDAAAQQLQKALNNLKWKASTILIDSLKEAIQGLLDIKENYTDLEFADAQSAIDKANELLAKDADNLSRDEVSEAIWLIAQVKAELKHNVHLDALRVLLEQARTILASDEIKDVRPDKVKALNDAIAAGQALLDANSSNEAAIEAAQTSLYKAIQELYKIVDKQLLIDMIEKVAQMDEQLYTSRSWKALKDAVQVAQKVVDNADATVAEVQQAYYDVMNAIVKLEVKSDKRALAQQLAIAKKMLDKKENYVPSSIRKLEAAVANAQDVYDDEYASAKEVKAVCDALIKVMSEARLKADKTALEAAVQEARAMNLTMYTSPGKALLEAAIANADKVLKNEEATPNQVKDALQQIKDAISKLEVDNKKQPNKENQAGNQDNITHAATGDQAKQELFLIIMMLSGLLVFYKARKIRKRS